MVTHLLAGDALGRLYPDAWIPLTGRQHRHLVEELVYSSQQVAAVLGLVRDLVEHLQTPHKTSSTLVYMEMAELL